MVPFDQVAVAVYDWLVPDGITAEAGVTEMETMTGGPHVTVSVPVVAPFRQLCWTVTVPVAPCCVQEQTQSVQTTAPDGVHVADGGGPFVPSEKVQETPGVKGASDPSGSCAEACTMHETHSAATTVTVTVSLTVPSETVTVATLAARCTWRCTTCRDSA